MATRASRRHVLVGASFAGSALAAASAAQPAGPGRPPVAEPADDVRRLAFARSLLGRGRKTVRRSITIRGRRIAYDTTLGAIEVRGPDQPPAIFVFTAYTRANVDVSPRPLTFAWAGGPSIASTSFHLNALGPRMSPLDGASGLVDNDMSLLDRSDLVFVDPVGTGWSMPDVGAAYEDFYSVVKDARAVSRFIQEYRTAEARTESPLYLAGRSYGTVRLASVAHDLTQAGVKLTGLFPVAPAMDGNAFWESSGNMTAFYLMVPNYAAIAWYHKRQAQPAATVEAALQEAAEFALGDYISALMTWDVLAPERRAAVLQRLEALTGIRQEVWAANRLRINGRLFTAEFLKTEGKAPFSSDARKTRDLTPGRTSAAPVAADATGEGIMDVYVRQELGVAGAPVYRFGAPGIADGGPPREWAVDRRHLYELGAFKMTALPNFLDDIAETMKANPELRVQQHSGMYDLTSSSFPADWSLRNMNIPEGLRRNVQMFDYPSGHTIYDTPADFEAFMTRVAALYPV